MFPIKVTYSGKTLLFQIKEENPPSLKLLEQKIRSLFRINGKNINIFWKDSDGDKISLETDEALQIALEISQKHDWIFKLVVTGRLLDL